MCVHIIMVSILLCLCIFYNIIVGNTSPWDFFNMSLLGMGYSSTVFYVS